LMAEAGHRSYEQMRVAVLEFLDTDVFQISVEGYVSFLDPIIDTWEIDLRTFSLEIVLNPRLAPAGFKRFEFVESPDERSLTVEPGLDQFLKDESLSGGATKEEIAFLSTLRFGGRRPTPLYYYRELQSLRDPLHFASSERAAGSD
jgi:hypothetical protein